MFGGVMSVFGGIRSALLGWGFCESCLLFNAPFWVFLCKFLITGGLVG